MSLLSQRRSSNDANLELRRRNSSGGRLLVGAPRFMARLGSWLQPQSCTITKYACAGRDGRSRQPLEAAEVACGTCWQRGPFVWAAAASAAAAAALRAGESYRAHLIAALPRRGSARARRIERGRRGGAKELP